MTQGIYRVGIDLNQDAYFARGVSVSDTMNRIYLSDRLAYGALNGATVFYERDFRGLDYNNNYDVTTGTSADAGIRIGGTSSDLLYQCITVPSASEITARVRVVGQAGAEISVQVRNFFGGVHSAISTATLDGSANGTEISVTYTPVSVGIFLYVYRSSTTNNVTFNVRNVMVVSGASVPTAYNTGNPRDAYEDITDLVVSAQWNTGMSSAQQEVGENPRCILTCDNRDGHFNQDGFGAELFVNGVYPITFTGDDPDGWTLGAAESPGVYEVSEVGWDSLWTGAGTGAVNIQAGPYNPPIITTQNILTVGETYRVAFDIGAIADSTAITFYSGSAIVADFYAKPGHYEFTFTAANVAFGIGGPPIVSVNATIGNLSVKACPRYYGLSRDVLVAIDGFLSADAGFPLFRGRLTNIKLQGSAVSTKVAVLELEGGFDTLMDLEYKPSVLAANTLVSSAILRLFQQIAYTWPYSRSYFNLDSSFLGYNTWIFDGYTPVTSDASTTLDYEGDLASNRERGVSTSAYIRDLMAAEFGGRFYMHPFSGQAIFDGRNRDYSFISNTDTLTDDDYDAYEYVYGEDVINRVTVWYKQRRFDGNTVVIWASDSSIVVRAKTENKRITGRYRNPSDEKSQVSAFNTTPLVPGTDYTITPTKAAANVAIVVLPGTQSITFEITNNGASDVTISGLQVRGTLIYALTEQAVTAENADSIFRFNVHEESFNVPLVSDEEDALAFASGRVAQYGYPVGQLRSITFSANKTLARYQRAILRTIPDQVTITQSTNGHTGKYAVVGIRHSLQAGEEHTHEVTWILKPVDRVTYWYLGEAGRSELSITTNLAF